nr:hypothetical protein CFP56_28570 [Quercus suber]
MGFHSYGVYLVCTRILRRYRQQLHVSASRSTKGEANAELDSEDMVTARCTTSSKNVKSIQTGLPCIGGRNTMFPMHEFPHARLRICSRCTVDKLH